MANDCSGIDNWEIEGCRIIEMGIYYKSRNSKLGLQSRRKRATAQRIYRNIFYKH
jgi:hypothetical protein